MDPEITAMSTIADALGGQNLNDEKRRQVVRWHMPTTQLEIDCQVAIVAALSPLSKPQRERVIRWTASRWATPPKTRQPRAPKGENLRAAS